MDKKERSRGLTQIRSDTLLFFHFFFLSMSNKIFRTKGSHSNEWCIQKTNNGVQNVPLDWSMVCQTSVTAPFFFFFFGAASPCVFALSRWPRWTEDMYVRDTVKASPTISHDWFCPLPVGGRDKHIPHGALVRQIVYRECHCYWKAHFPWQGSAISPPPLLLSRSDKYS